MFSAIHILPLLPVLMAFQDSTEPPGWVTFGSWQGDFAFSMPGQPKSRSKYSLKLDRFCEAEHLYWCQVRGSRFSAQSTSLRPAAAEGIAPFLEAKKKEYLQAQVGQAAETAVEVDGIGGQEITYKEIVHPSNATVTIKVRHFVKGDHYYVVAVTSPPDKALSPEADRFLSSLTFKPVWIKIKRADGTPEDALRTFVLASLAHDEGSLRAVTLAHPEIDRLLNGPTAPPQAIRQMMLQLPRRPIRRLKSGDRVTLPDKRIFIVDAPAVDENHAVLLMQDDSFPFHVLRIGGHWKVWPEPAIAASKAAEAARQKARLK